MVIFHVVNVDTLVSGISSVVHQLSAAQRAAGHRVCVLNIHPTSKDIHDFEKCGSVAQFRGALRVHRPDVVVFHGLFYPAILPFAMAARRVGVKYLLQPHGAYSAENYRKGHLRKWAYRHLVLCHVIRGAAGWIFLNDGERRNFAIPLRRKGVVTVPNGCCRSETGRVATHRGVEEDGMEKREVVLTYIGRIDVHAKGLDTLVVAFRVMDADGVRCRLDVYGDACDAEIEGFRQFVEPLGGRVRFCGPVFGEEKERVLDATDILVLLSRSEGFPMCVLEGLAHGAPCLVSPQTNVADIVQRYGCGWVSPTHCAEDVARVIGECCRSYRSDAVELRRRALVAADAYTWDKVAATAVDGYRELTGL